MKLNKNYLFISISSLALVLVLFIQVKWILQAAKNKEDLFNEKANIVLARTTEALTNDSDTWRKLEMSGGRLGFQKVDSVIRKYMSYYNFHVAYSYEIVRPAPSIAFQVKEYNRSATDTVPTACYASSLDEMNSRNDWELKLNFPGKERYIRSEMRMPFMASVFLILVVLVLFWRTTLSLMTEKKIAEHTTDFLNNMTHEFKTPLTNIALAGKMITKETAVNSEDKIKQYTGIILGENEKLRLQVEQVLSMSALERGEIPLLKTELDFHEVIREALKYIGIQAENKEGYVQTELHAEQCRISGDRTHLSNALCNLVDNAIKYSKETPQILVQTSNSGSNLVVTVSDKGIGIDREYQKRVFDKFFRVPTGNVHDVKGFGLGLAYIKKIVELHGGTIELESEKGRGSTFIIQVPYV
jgi:two-component system phosphate regulon sensor histidine kinase PhoR